MDNVNLHNRDLHIWVDPNDSSNVCGMEEFLLFHDKEIIEMFRDSLNQVQLLELTFKEQTLLYAYLVVTCGK